MLLRAGWDGLGLDLVILEVFSNPNDSTILFLQLSAQWGKAELVLMVKLLAVFTGKPLDPAVPVTHTVSNVICALILGHRFSLEDKRFLRLVEAVDDISAFANSVSFYVRIMIFLCYFIHR